MDLFVSKETQLMLLLLFKHINAQCVLFLADRSL